MNIMSQCNICNQGFSRKDSLTRHKKRKNLYSEVDGGHQTSWKYKKRSSANAHNISRAVSHGSSLTRDQPTETSSYAWRGGSSIVSSDERSLVEISDENSVTFNPRAKADIATYVWRDDGSIKKNHSILIPRDVRAESSDDESTGDESSDESGNDESSIFDISNYSWCDDGTIKKNHSFQLPRDIRAIIVGKSGSGKTTLLTSLLLKPDVLDYENLMVCGKSLHQPSYKIMQLGFEAYQSHK